MFKRLRIPKDQFTDLKTNSVELSKLDGTVNFPNSSTAPTIQ